MADASFPVPMRKTGYPTRREMARLVRSGVVASAVAGALLSCGPEQGTSPGDAGKEEKADVPHTEEAWVTPGLVIDTVSTDRWEKPDMETKMQKEDFYVPDRKGADTRDEKIIITESCTSGVSIPKVDPSS